MLMELSGILGSYYKIASVALSWTVVFQVFIVALFSWIIYTQLLRIYISPLRYLPSTRFIPIVGSLPQLINSEAGEFSEYWVEVLKSPVFRFYGLFGEEKISVGDADVIKDILVTKSKLYRKSVSTYRPLKNLLGEGLVTAEGNIHRKNRRICNGSFKINILKNMVPVFDNSVKSLVDMWLTDIKNTKSKDAGQTSVEIPIQKELTNITLEIIGKCAFDYNFESIQHKSSDITNNFRKLIGGFQLSWNMILHILFPFLKTKFTTNHNSYIEKANKVVYSVIKRNRKLDIPSDDSKMTSLLTSLIRAKYEDTGDTMDDKQLRDEVMTFMLAGHETTSVAMSWCLLQMARYPHIQNKVREEVQSVLPPEGEPITFEHLEKLTYLTCVIQETMRVYPPVPIVGREAIEDNVIQGYFIPKGVNIDINIMTVHKNLQYWDKPNEFYPERFEDPSKIYPYSYIPFIAGSRMCIGYKFAMMEMKTILAYLIRRFQFSPLPHITYRRVMLATLRPDPHVVLKVKELE